MVPEIRIPDHGFRLYVKPSLPKEDLLLFLKISICYIGLNVNFYINNFLKRVAVETFIVRKC